MCQSTSQPSNKNEKFEALLWKKIQTELEDTCKLHTSSMPSSTTLFSSTPISLTLCCSSSMPDVIDTGVTDKSSDTIYVTKFFTTPPSPAEGFLQLQVEIPESTNRSNLKRQSIRREQFLPGQFVFAASDIIVVYTSVENVSLKCWTSFRQQGRSIEGSCYMAFQEVIFILIWLQVSIIQVFKALIQIIYAPQCAAILEEPDDSTNRQRKEIEQKIHKIFLGLCYDNLVSSFLYY